MKRSAPCPRGCAEAAPPAPGARHARLAGLHTGAFLVCSLLVVSSASATGPLGAGTQVPSTTVRLGLINDNLNLGIGAVAALFRYDRMDGNDSGCTHGMDLAVEQLGAAGVTGTWALSSRLYTRRQSEPAPGEQRGEIPVWFTEEETFSYISDTRLQQRLFFSELGGGIHYDGKSFNSLGASGQQQLFHRTVNTSHQTTYRFLDDKRARLGAFLHAGFGIQKRWPLHLHLAATASARLAVEPNTMSAASRLVQESAAGLSVATRTSEISLAVSVESVLHPEGIAVSPAIELAYQWSRWGVRSAVGFPQGKLQNHVFYNDDHDPIASLSVFVRFVP